MGAVSWPWRCQPCPRHLEPRLCPAPDPHMRSATDRPPPLLAAHGHRPGLPANPRRRIARPLSSYPSSGSQRQTPGVGLLPPLVKMPCPEIFSKNHSQEITLRDGTRAKNFKPIWPGDNPEGQAHRYPLKKRVHASVACSALRPRGLVPGWGRCAGGAFGGQVRTGEG